MTGTKDTDQKKNDTHLEQVLQTVPGLIFKTSDFPKKSGEVTNTSCLLTEQPKKPNFECGFGNISDAVF